MIGNEISLPKFPTDLREIAAKTTLREVRQRGHTYVELRRDGKRVIFFCTICLTPCYNDNVLFDHLKGNLHARRFSAAKATLFGPVPWPFNDGVLFFNNSRENEERGSQSKALVVYDGSKKDGSGGNLNGNGGKNGKKGKGKFGGGKNGSKSLSRIESEFVIPRVLLKEEVSSIGVQLLGIGSVSYRLREFDEIRGKITKIWCAWNGKNEENSHNNSNEGVKAHNCDFAVVNFGYTFDLGRKWGSEEENLIESSNSFFMIEDSGKKGKKRKKSFSDQEASSEESQNQREKGMQIRIFDPKEKGVQQEKGTQIRVLDPKEKGMEIRVFDAKEAASRRELRKQKRIAAERACDICGQPMLPGKDVGALLNLKTRVLACSSRNPNGAFHLFHASCLVHWILLCEYEIMNEKLTNPKGNRGRKPKSNLKNQISSILCPECQGTGIHVENEEYEKPTVSLSEMFKYKLKAIEAHKAWMKNPEVLESCSTGLCFPSDSVEISQEKVVPLKQMHFYRADE